MRLRVVKPLRCLGAMAIVLCLFTATSWAALVVSFPDIFLSEETPTVVGNVLISADNGETITSANINVIATGPKPIFLDAWTPTPAGNVWLGATSLSTAEIIPVDGTDFRSKLNTTIEQPENHSVAADGVLMAVTFDTSAGLLGDVFDIDLNTTLGNFSTVSLFGNAYTDVTYMPGQIMIGLPDPSPPSPLTGVNLFSDTFDRPDTIGLSVDAVTDGMSSDVFTPAADTTYSEFTGQASGVEAVISGSKMYLAQGPGQSYAGIDRNFIDQEILDAGGFAIEAIVDPRTGANGTPDNRYAAIGVGLLQATATSQTSDAVEGSDSDRQILEQAALAFTVEDDGQYNLFDSWAIESGASSATPANLTDDTHDTESKIDDGVTSFFDQVGLKTLQHEYKVRLEFDVDSFEADSEVVLTAFIEDVQIDLDPSNGIEDNPGDRDTYTFAWDGSDQNYIAFEGRTQESASFDFLMIESFAASALAGDYNNSGLVEQADLDLVLLNWGGETPPIPDGWVNDPPDGLVDQAELDRVLLNWGASNSVATESVPEPSTLWLLAWGVLVLSRRLTNL